MKPKKKEKKQFKKTVIGLLNNEEEKEAMVYVEEMMKRVNKKTTSIGSGYFFVHRGPVFKDGKQIDYMFEVKRNIAEIIISKPRKKRKLKKRR